MKTILITGSTDGIGKLAAESLAKLGHKVIVHGRNEAKLAKVVSEIRDRTENHNVTGIAGDLSTAESVRKLAKEIADFIGTIDVLINNAGVYKTTNPRNTQGLDMRFMVNYLAPYLLTHHLLDHDTVNIERIINLSSAAQSPVTLKALEGKEDLQENEAYAQSKLALTMWSFDLAEKFPDTTIIAVNPGSLLNTNMVKEAFGKHWSPASKGSEILVDLAVSEKYQNDTGKYFDNDKEAFGTAHADAYHQNKIQQLLNTTRKILKD